MFCTSADKGNFPPQNPLWIGQKPAGIWVLMGEYSVGAYG